MKAKGSALWAWGIVVLSLGLTLLGAWALMSRLNDNRTDVTLGSSVFSCRIVNTEESRERGLSGTDTLGDHEGMLFVFDREGPQPIWMKDMNYSIDIVWLNADKEVVTVAANVSPDTYPKTFSAQKPARYVVELPAGAAAKSGVTRGTVASFDLR